MTLSPPTALPAVRPSIGWAVALAAVSLICLFVRRSRRSGLPLPPGPRGRFLVGNLGQVSADHPERDYIRWGKEFDSDIIHLKVLGQHSICLNTVEAATELLDRRGSNYCDRPRFTLFEVMGWGLTLTFLRWGPQFKLHRSLFQKTFTQSNVKVFRPVQLHEARKAVRTLLVRPDAWEEATLLMTTSIIFRIAFGQEIVDVSSPYCAMSAAANEATTNGGIAGTSLVDVFPPARFLPDWLNPSAALRHARNSRAAIRTIHDVPWAASLKDIEAGEAPPSFMRTHYERLQESIRAGRPLEMTERDVKGATGAIFIAGGNSTWSTVLSNLLFLTKYPDAQRAIRDELDTVLDGGSRLPEFDDRTSLGSLDRFMQEVMRALPLNPLVIPHKSLREDEFRGMRIPAGSVVFANAKAMGSDPRVYNDPERFDPDRYTRGEPYPNGNFGFGRRKCPGNFLAMATVYMFLATLLAVFEIEKAVGPDGKPVEPVPGVTIGLGGHPSPFQCKLRLRNPALAKLLAEGKDEA
ncbi:cytochrome p450 monooxygenase [Grosmannia clavigera kw1407]|uniref:Cytochrome p450 monooxygenase n=1 Tax=Grosmannia clavigera (strain kw1407 / UAMH 11150) TaxID=655863 RepID=F0XJZ6_GROCL|nr:cytochrome p450 monooxygenase [Grosmannia clavigera kw1407]EFX01959.1 cytochrome p450 monooxygenase [Grosmannia clavigera kw1407]